jgi:glutathione S-transferase
VTTETREKDNNDARRDCLKGHKWEFADLCLAGAMYNISRVPRRHDETPSVQPWVQRSEQQLGGSSVKE